MVFRGLKGVGGRTSGLGGVALLGLRFSDSLDSFVQVSGRYNF